MMCKSYLTQLGATRTKTFKKYTPKVVVPHTVSVLFLVIGLFFVSRVQGQSHYYWHNAKKVPFEKLEDTTALLFGNNPVLNQNFLLSSGENILALDVSAISRGLYKVSITCGASEGNSHSLIIN